MEGPIGGRAELAKGGAREALIRSAIHLIARNGLRGTTYRAVAADAGLTHGMIVHCFGSRDALIAAAMEYAVQRMLRDARTPMPGEIDEIGAHLIEMIANDLDAVAFQREMLNESRRRPELAPLARRMILEFEEGVRRQLHGLGIVDEDVVMLVAAAMSGLVTRGLTIDDPADLERALHELRRYVAGQVARDPQST